MSVIVCIISFIRSVLALTLALASIPWPWPWVWYGAGLVNISLVTAAYTGCPALVTHDGAASGSGLRHSGTGRRHVSSGEVPLVAADWPQVDGGVRPVRAGVEGTRADRVPQRPVSSPLQHTGNLQVWSLACKPVKIKVKGTYTWYSAASWNTTSERSWHAFSRDLTVLPAHPHVHPQSEWAIVCLPSYSWYSYTDPGGMEGWVGLGGWLRSETVYLPKGSHPSHY